jgi:hypothetical protein
MQEILKEDKMFKEGDITPKDLLRFAKLILGVIAILFVGSAITELYVPNSGIFEVCKITLPSLATLIIGFYFGKS